MAKPSDENRGVRKGRREFDWLCGSICQEDIFTYFDCSEDAKSFANKNAHKQLLIADSGHSKIVVVPVGLELAFFALAKMPLNGLLGPFCGGQSKAD